MQRSGFIVGVAALIIVALAGTSALAALPTPKDVTRVRLRCSDQEKIFVLGFLTKDEDKVASSDFGLACQPGETKIFRYPEAKQANDAFFIYIAEHPNGNTARPNKCFLGTKDESAGDIDGDGTSPDTYHEDFRVGRAYKLESPSTGGTCNAQPTPNANDPKLSVLIFEGDPQKERRPLLLFENFSQTITHTQTASVKISKSQFSGAIDLFGITLVVAIFGDSSSTSGGPWASIGHISVTTTPSGFPTSALAGTPPNRITFQLRHAVSGNCPTSFTGFDPTNGNAHGTGASAVGALVDPLNPGDGPWCLIKIPKTDDAGDALYRVVLTVQGPGGVVTAFHFVLVKHGTSTAGLASGEIVPLSVQKVQFANTMLRKNQSLLVNVQGRGIASTELTVFDLTGRRIAQVSARGQTLRWIPADANGRPLANGVYLYVVKVKGYDGKVISTEVRKFVVLR